MGFWKIFWIVVLAIILSPLILAFAPVILLAALLYWLFKKEDEEKKPEEKKPEEKTP